MAELPTNTLQKSLEALQAFKKNAAIQHESYPVFDTVCKATYTYDGKSKSGDIEVTVDESSEYNGRIKILAMFDTSELRVTFTTKFDKYTFEDSKLIITGCYMKKPFKIEIGEFAKGSRLLRG